MSTQAHPVNQASVMHVVSELLIVCVGLFVLSFLLPDGFIDAVTQHFGSVGSFIMGFLVYLAIRVWFLSRPCRVKSGRKVTGGRS